jgi:hypothetical protein
MLNEPSEQGTGIARDTGVSRVPVTGRSVHSGLQEVWSYPRVC